MVYGEQNGEKQYYLTNAHGDVDMLADGAGNVIKTYTYDAFGVETNKDEADANPFRYAGEYYDGETDSIYLRARYYAPRTGRFTTEDPIRDGLNWYSYCGGNPVMKVDPSGLGDIIAVRQFAVNSLGANVEWNDTDKYAKIQLSYGPSFEFTANSSDDDSAYIASDGVMYADKKVFLEKLNITSYAVDSYENQVDGTVRMSAVIFCTKPSNILQDGQYTLQIRLNGKLCFQNNDYFPYITKAEINSPSQSNIDLINGYRAQNTLSAISDLANSDGMKVFTNILSNVDITKDELSYTDIRVRLNGDFYFFDRYFVYKKYASVMGQAIRLF